MNMLDGEVSAAVMEAMKSALRMNFSVVRLSLFYYRHMQQDAAVVVGPSQKELHLDSQA